MGHVTCGQCSSLISDHSGQYEAELYPDLWNIEDGKCFDVYECQECGSLTIFYNFHSRKGFHVYTPKNGKNNELTRTDACKFKD